MKEQNAERLSEYEKAQIAVSYTHLDVYKRQVKIKSDITKYMEENLKLELSQEKTLITNAQKLSLIHI